MLKRIPKSDFSINSLIGESTVFKGEFQAKGPLRIDGNFKGKIDSSGKVFIGKHGKAECLVLAKIVIIGGKVEGDIYAMDNVIALKTAEIIGNIYSSSIKIEDGVTLEGQCRVLSKNDMKELMEKKRKENDKVLI